MPNPFFSAAATTVQWIQVDGANETDISGATNETYTLATADEGKKIKVKVSFEDEDGTAEGPLTSDAYPSSATVTAANTAPTSADEHVEADEDTDYTFEADDFLFTDTDTGDSLASIKIVTLPASGKGTLTLSGTVIGSGDLPQTVLAAEIDNLKFSPPANLNGLDFATFTFKVNDGTVDSDDAFTITVDVTAMNDPATGEPTISGTARVGRMLTVSTAGIMDVDGLPSTFSYRWLRKVGATTTSISGANSSTYTLQAADLGNKVAVRVSFTDTGGNSEMRTSGDYPTSGTVLANNTLVSNAGQIESDFGSLAADDLAQSFTTGTNATGYTLSSIELNLDSTVSTNTPTVKLYSGSANGTEVSTFTGPATLGSGIASYTFTPFSTVTLRRSTTYWVVAEGATRWTHTRSAEDATPATGWSIADNYEFRTASLTGSFTATNTGDALQIRVNGTLGGIVLSSDATLSALALEDASDDSAITISPVFASATTSYTASVDNDVDGITIKPTVNESNATVEYLDSSDTEIADAISGKTGQQVLLAVGANTIKVKVTAEDTTTANPYTVVVTRAVVADTTPPEVVSVTVPISGSEVELVFDEDLDGNVGGNLLASVFSLTVAGQAVTIPDYDYAIQEAALFLYVQPGTIKQGQTVVVSYTDPTAGDDTVALQDIAGNDVASFTTGMSGVPAVTNDSTVTPNTAPTGADNTVTMATDRSYTFVADEFGFADTDAGDTLDSISIVTPPASGTLAFDGTAVMADDVVTKAQLDNIFGDHLTFTPAAGASGDPYTSFTFKVNDGTDDSAAAYTMSITVNAIGAVSTAEVPDNWALKPADIGAGEQFRLIFQASGHPATSADIATYNSHVRSDAGAGVTALRSYADDFRALVSTQAVNVRTNTMTRATDTGVPIYWVRSDPVVAGDRVADNYADFYDGSWATGGTGYGARGFSRLLDTHVTWTGSNANGTTHSTGYMGASSNLAIWSVSSSGAISTVAEDPPSSNYGIFALSPVFQVSTTTVNTAATGVPTITGTAQVGETLTAVTTGIMDADGLTSPTYTYQWIRVDGSEADIASANSSTYTLDAADLGKTIKVKVSFTDDASNTETLTSAATATVTAATVTPVSGVLVSNVGQTPFDFVELNLLDAAQSFTTGDNATGYTLTSIELRFDSSASTDTPTVKLYSGSANGTEEATLIGPAMLDADTTKNYAFTSSSTVTLGMSTTYWVVAEANTGSVRWIDTHSPSEDATPAAHWTIADGREDRSASSTGSFMTTAGNPLLIRVNGTTVATPTTSSDATLSALALENASDDSAITISPTFASGTTSYTASVDNDVDGITIKPTVNESSATVEYLDSSDTAITDADAVKAGQQVSLLVGANTIKVKVTAEDTTTTNTYTVVVTRAANTAPTSADERVEADEDFDYTFSSDDFAFTDTDTGDSLASVKIVTLPASGTGTLTLSGTAIGSGDLPKTVLAAEIDELKYSPPANLYGTDVATFTFKVNDGTDDSADAYTMTIGVTAVNPATGAPAISGAAAVGQALTASTSGIEDVDGLTGASFTYQWVRVDADGTSNEEDISVATSASYTLVGADVGKRVRVRVTFNDDAGNAEGPLTSEAFPSSGTVGSANALTIRRLGGGTAGVCALLDTRPTPPVGGVFCLGVWFNGADPVGFTESDLEIENGTVVDFQSVGSTNTVQRITVNVTGDIGKEFVFRIVRNALDAGNAEAVYRATITAPPATLTMSSSAAEPVTGDFFIGLEFTHTVEGERGSLEPLTGRFPMITNINIGRFFEVTNGNLVRYANFAPIGDRNFDLVVRPYANFEGRLSVVFHTDRVQSADYSGIWFPEARFGIEVDTKSPTLETVALADDNRRLLDLTFHEELVAGSLPTVNDFRVVADGGSVGLATLHAPDGNTLRLRLSEAIAPGADATVSYIVPSTSRRLKDEVGNETPAFSRSFDTGPPEVTIAPGPTPVTEAQDAAAMFTLSRTGATAATLTVNVTVSETGDMIAAASEGAMSVNFEAGSETATLSVPIQNDSDDEIESTLSVDLVADTSEPPAYTLGAPAKASVTVEDDDTPNTAPTSADRTVTTAKDRAYAFTAADFSFADADSGDTLASVKIVTLPALGTLALDGTAVMAEQVVTKADIDDDKLTFTPVAGASGDPYATFTFKVNDGTDDSADAYTMTIHVTAVNHPATGAPAISGAAAVGQALTASTSGIEDVDGLTGASFTYQWVRVDADGTSNEEDISVATSASYTLVGADVGKRVRVRVTFNDDAGNAEGPLTSEAFPSSGTVGSANALTIRRLGGGTAGICAATDTRPNPPVGGVFCLGVWFNGADPVGFTESDLEIENGTVVDFQSVGSTNTVQRITVNVTGDIGKEFVFRIVRNALDAGNAEAVYRATITAPPATLTMSSSAAEPVTGDFFIDLEFTHTVEGERGSLEPLTGRFPMITNINIGRFFEVTNGNLVRYANFAPIGDRNFDLVVRPYANFEGRLSVVFHSDRVESADYSGIWFPEARFGIEVDTKSPTLETVALADDNRRLLDLTFHEELVAGSLPTVNDFRVVADGGSVGLATLHAPDGNTLRLRLSEAIAPGADATVSYIVPSTSRRLKDEVGNETPAFSRSFDTGPPEVTIAPGPTPVTEAQDAAAMFTLSRTGATAATLTVNVTVSETGDMIAAASEGAMSVNFEAGSETATLSVPIQNDSVDEIESTLTVDLVADTSEPPAYTLGAPAKASVTVEDDNTPNTAPMSEDRTVTTAEDRPYTFTAADFSFADADGNTLASVLIVTTPADGRLALNGTTVMASRTVTRTQIDDGNLIFEPATGGSGDPYTTFTFKVNDGTDDSASAYTMTIDVTAATAPGAPTALTATANGQSQIDLAWTAPADTGGPAIAITGYRIEVSPDGSSWSDLVAATASTATTYAHTGLNAATNRHYRVSAINAVGTSDPSGSDDATTEASTATAQTEMVPVDWALKPADIGVGEQFRLMFATSTFRNARSTNIADYNTFVRTSAAAGLTALHTYANDFTALVSTGSVNARANTLTRATDTDAPVYWVRSSVDATHRAADGYADFFDGSWATSWRGYNESGSQLSTTRFWTGSNTDGTTHATQFMGPTGATASAAHWLLATPDNVTGSTPSLSTSRIVALSPVFQVANTAPTGADKTVTIGSDTAYTFEADDFGFVDTDAGATLVSVRIESVPLAGDLELNGTAVSLNDVIPSADIGDLTFTPAAGGSGDAYASFMFKVNDGTDFSANVNTITFNVRDLSCAAPDFAGDNRRQLWTGIVTVGEIDDVGYGFRSDLSQTELNDTTFAIGRNSYTVDSAFVLSASPFVGQMRFSLAGNEQNNLTAGERAALRLHVCDTAIYNFSASGANAENTYDWAGSLDWSPPVATRTLYLSLPANRDAMGEPAITGTAQVGQDLTADVTGITDADGLTGDLSTPTDDSNLGGVEYSYQWIRVDADGASNEEDISGEIAETYTLTDDDEGKKVKVKVGFTDDLNGEEERTSAAYPSSGTVTAANTAPVFSSPSVSRSIAENTAAGQNVGAAVTATDADAGDTLAYTLGGTDAASFDFVEATGQIRTKTGVSYDFEAKSSYTVTVTASDGTATAVATVTISITDVAEPPDAPTTIPVSAVAGSTTSLTVSWTAPANAGRPDIDNYDVQYRVSGATAWTDGPQNVTTTTTTIAGLVADTLYEVQVRATNAEGDSGWSDPPVSGRTNAPPNTAPTSADEHVEADEDTDYTFSSADFPFTDTAGDSLASIKIVTLPASGTGTLTLSGTTIGSGDLPKTVLTAEIDDLKYSPPANLYGTDFATFTFKVNDGTVDSDDAFTITVDVTAMNDPATGKPGITGTAQVGQTLTATAGTIADVEGVPNPFFSAAATTVQWIQVDGATETDISGATNETYTLATADEGKKIKVKVSFEDEDGTAEGPLTSDAYPSSATVTAAPVTNNAPVFSSPSVSREIAENTAAGQNVGAAVTATDADAGDTLGYTLGGTDAASFDFVESSGQIRTKTNVSYDFEAKDSYTVTVTASDGTATAVATVTISITDVAEPPDAPPTISVSAVAGSTTSLTVSWTAPANAGRPAIDNYDVQYRVSGAAAWTDGPQNVTTTTTTISGLVADTLYEVQVRATNAEGDSGWSDPPVSGRTNSPANNAPEFATDTTSRSFTETVGDAAVSTAGNVGAVVTATDADSDTLTYSLEGTDVAKFGIVSGSGQIQTKVGEKYDREAKASYSVTVKADDSNGGSDTIAVTITVDNAVEKPLAPAMPAVTATSGITTSLDVSWMAPANTGRPAITGYKVEYRAGVSGNWINHPHTGTGTTATIATLTAATAYQVQVLAVNSDGDGLFSSPGSGTTGTNTPATGVPTITGTAQVGQTLTAVTTGIADANGLTSPTYTYQWIRANGTEADIAAANSSTYTLDAADLGKTIKVKVSFADDDGNPETLTSAATATVTAAPTAQTEVWTATLTPGDLQLSILGCGNHIDSARCSTTTVLSEDSFNYDSTDYTITKLFVRSGGHFQLDFDADITTATAALTLVVGSTSLVLADADTIASRQRIWHNSGVSLTEGTDIVVKLIAPDTNTSSDATLSALALEDASDDSAITISPAFASGMTSYTASVDNDVDEITIKPAVNESHAMVEYLDSSDTAITDADSGKTGQQVSLSVSANTIKVKVTAEDTTTTNTYTVVVTRAANNAPTAVEQLVDADEDTDYTFTADDFGFADTDAGDSLVSVKIVTLPASGTGTLTLSGTAIGSGDLPKTVPADDLDELKYSPPANLYGTDVASFTFKVNDGTVDSDNAYTMTIDVKGMDDPVTGKPGITGTAQVGQTLTATAGTIADVDGLPNPFFSAAATTIQWIQVDGATETDISGATNETYTLATADEGKKIKVKVSFEDEGGTAEGPLTSDAYPSSGTVLGANNAPVFSPAMPEREIAENTAAGVDVGAAVTATDADAGDNLTYMLGGADMASFDFVGTTGQIRTKTNVSYDFEAKSSYTVTVTATDNSNATAVADVTISITDVDEPPSAPATPMVSAVSGSTTSLSVSWAAPANAGKPAIANYDVQYRLGSSGAWIDGPQDVMTMTATVTGLVADTLYEARVRATNAEGDSGWSDPPGSSRTNSLTNNAPTGADKTVTIGSDMAYTFSVDDFGFADGDDDTLASVRIEALPGAGTLALDNTAVSLNDVIPSADIGNLTFTPTSGQSGDNYVNFTFKVNDGTVFSDNANTITFNVRDLSCAAPDFAGDGRRQLWSGTVTVGDIESEGYGFRSDLSQTGLDDTTFAIGRNSYTVDTAYVESVYFSGRLSFGLTGDVNDSLTAGEKAALRLHVCAATSYDFSATGANGENTYKWAGSLDWSPPVVTRTLYLSLPANHDAMGAPTITGTARVAQELTADVTGVTDADGLTGDLSTRFDNSNPSGVEYSYQWIRVGADGASNPTIISGATEATYTLTDGDAGKKVKVQVSFTDDLNGEEELTSEAFPSTDTVSANNAPVFSSPSVSRSIAENTAAGVNVGAAVTATDTDTLTYTLGGTDMASFDIVRTTGQIRTKAGVGYDHEAKDSYTVTVTASDGAGSAVANVTISVTDVDEPPDAPAPPMVLAVAASTTSLSVSWAAPANDGKPPIDSYDVQYRAGSSGTWSAGPQNIATTTTTIIGLVADTLYQARVRATNAEGDSGWSSPPGSGRTNALGVAQTGALVSNTGQANSGQRVVGTDEYAQPFDTGNNSSGYNLAGIVLDLQAAPTGTGTLTITVREDLSGNPVRAALYTLVNPALAAGLNEFRAPGNAELDANTTYWVVATYSADTGGPTWYRTVRSRVDAGAAAGWAIDATYKIDGRVARDGWVVDSSPRALQIAVKGTAIGGANTAPTAADNTLATAVDTPYTFTADDFGFTDTDAADMLASVRIVTVPAAGELALDGTAVLADAVVTKADIDDDKLTFTPVAGAGGDPYTTFTFKVNDGTVDSANAYTMTIDVTAVAAEPPSAPATPIVSAVSGSSTSLSVSWAAPANAGKPPIDSYDVQYRVGNSGDWSDGPENVMGTTVTVTGLAADTDYEVRVRATNAEGNSGWSDPPGSGRTNATITSAPGAPGNLRTTPGDGRVTLTWTAPANTGGAAILKYRYRARQTGTTAWTPNWMDVPDGSDPGSSAADETRVMVSGLTNGTEYRFEVRAVNRIGGGTAVSRNETPVATPARAPRRPRSLLAASGDGQVTLTWEAPQNDGGADIVRYDYRHAQGTSVPASEPWLSAGLNLRQTVAGLDNGRQYTFEVRAANSAGESDPASIQARPAANANAPSAPRFLKAITSDRHVGLTWLAPARDGGSSILKYEYRHASGASVPDDTPWSSGTSYRLQAGFGSLINGQLYTFQVRAVGADEGPAASVTANPSAKPVRRLPGAVSGLAATAEAYADDHRRRQYGRVSLSWSPPAGDDNSVLERFEYRYAESGSALPAKWLHGPSDRLSETVKRLKLETVYVFEVRAVNLEGPGPAVRRLIRTPASAVGTGLISLYATQSTAIEGGALTFEVRRAAHKDLGPDEAYVLVGVTDSAFPDIPALGGPLGGTGAGGHVVQFQPGATSATDTITVEFDGAQPASRSLTITLQSVQSPYYYGTPETLVIEVSDRDAALRVRDARVREGPGAMLAFAVTLDRPRDREVRVNYATSDGTATEGDDYTRTAGTLVFSARETFKTVSVPVLDDAHDEGSETLTLTLSNARGAAIDDATAVGTIVNSDPLPNAWLSRFGRAASDHVVQSIGRRLEGGARESHLTVMGWRADSLFEPSHSERDAREPRPDAPGRQPEGSVLAPDGRIGAPRAMTGATRGFGAMSGPGAAAPAFDGAMAQGFPPMQGGKLQSPAHAMGGLPANASGSPANAGGHPASASAMGASDNRWLNLMGRLFMALGPNGGEALAMPGLRDMVMGSSFYYGHSPDAGPLRGMNRLTAWGESASTRFSGAEGKLSLDGEVNTAILGADGEWGRWLAGLALSYSEGEGGYRQASAKGGAVSSTLSGINPYARYRLDERTSLWATLGYGSGRLTLTPDGAESALETDMTNAMAAFGGRGVLSMRSGETGQFELAVRTDAMLTDTASMAVVGLSAGEGATSRIRLILEGSGSLPAFGGVLAPKVEAGLRYDGGDAETGAGLEVGGGLAYDMARLTVQVDGRVLLTHRDRDYEEWGYSLSFVYQPAQDGRGLRYRAGSQWGATQSGVQSLWSLQNAGGLASGARTADGQRYTAELGYGFGLRRLWYPYVATESGGASSQALRFGLKLNAASDLEAGLEIGRLAHLSGQMENDIRLQWQARW